MEAFGALFNSLFLIPTLNLLIFLYKIFELIHFPGAFGMAIIALTILVRLVLWPLTHTQLKSAQKMSSLKPLLDELKSKHSDKTELQKAQMDLYKQHGINPAAGCLPTLVQFPILIALYQAIIHFFPQSTGMVTTNLNWVNSVVYNNWLHLTTSPDPHFLGLNLATRPSEFVSAGMLLLLIPIVTGLLTFVQSKMMIPAKPLKVYPKDSPKEVKEKESMEDAMAGMQSQMVFLMPVMIAYFAFQFPIGLALYWNTVTILGILQQYLISGWGGMTGLMKMAGIAVNEKTPGTKVTVERRK